MSHPTPPSPPRAASVRFTVSIDPDALAAYQRLADASGLSLARCVGEFLADMRDTAELIGTKVLQARRDPKGVLLELDALATMFSTATTAAVAAAAGPPGKRSAAGPAVTGPRPRYPRK